MSKTFKEAGLPLPPVGSVFRAGLVKKIASPHPYCVTPKHVAVAADQFSGMLTEEAIRAAEKQGAKCGICQERGGGILSYNAHYGPLAAHIEIPAGYTNLNDIPGLGKYLASIKEVATKAGIEGFAFPQIRG